MDAWDFLFHYIIPPIFSALLVATVFYLLFNALSIAIDIPFIKLFFFAFIGSSFSSVMRYNKDNKEVKK